MFLAYLGYPGRYADAFCWNGGDATLASYGLHGLSGAAAAARLPPTHRAFFLSLRSYAYVERFFCVHAGVRPTRPLDAQSEEDLLWIREEFIAEPHAFPYTVLYGHTPQRDVNVDLPFKIGLDTGLVYGNLLSCLELSQRELWQVARGAHSVERRSLAREFTAAGLG
jgi:serine/threonine protein phosphatase 1